MSPHIERFFIHLRQSYRQAIIAHADAPWVIRELVLASLLIGMTIWLSPLPWLADLLCASAIAASGHLSYRRERDKHKLSSNQISAVAVDGVDVDIAHHIRHILLFEPTLGVAEDRIYAVTRKHWIILIPLLSPCLLFGAVSAALAYYTSSVKLITVLVIANLVFFQYQHGKWAHVYMVLTNERFILLHDPYWPLPDSELPVQLVHILNCNPMDTVWGNLLGYGSIDLDTAGDRDTALHDLGKVPNASRLAAAINTLRLQKSRP